jgi:AraC family transcriptional regulator
MTLSHSTALKLTETSKAGRATTSFPEAGRLRERVFKSQVLSKPSAAPDFLKPTIKISSSGAVKRHCASLHGLIAESLYVPAQTKIEFYFKAPTHLLVMYSEGTRGDGSSFVEGLPPSNLRRMANKLTFVPAGHTFKEWHETWAALHIKYLYVDPSKISRSDNEDAAFAPKAFLDDAVVWDTAVKLTNVIEGGRGDIVYIDALTKVLAHELSQSPQEIPSTSPLSRGGLATWQMRVVTEHIAARLDQQISLETLAGLARLSQSHFARAFKQSFGVPPHEYHVCKRIDKAKTMLAEYDASVTEVGFALGYSHTSSFTVAFRKVTGRTPREFRKEFV